MDAINKIKSEKSSDWKQLTEYNVQTKQSSNARQDVYILPLHKESEMSEAMYPPSIHFSAKKFYDTAIWLNDLMFAADILDEQFQRDMMFINKEIAADISEQVPFRMDPS